MKSGLKGLALVLPLLAGCTEFPQSRWEQLRDLRESLRGPEVAPFAPPSLTRFDQQYWRLHKALLEADGTLLLPQESDILERRLEICLSWGRLLLEHSLKSRQLLAEQQEAELERLSLGLDSARVASRWNPVLRTMVTAAELELQLARIEWQQGNLSRVEELVGQLRQSYEAFESELATTEKRFNDSILRDVWNSWVTETISRSRRDRAPVLIIDKRRRLARLYRSGRLLKTFNIDLGWNPIPDKLHQGDGATPEGQYRVLQKKNARETKYHRALLIDYPNRRDREIFRQAQSNGEVPTGRSIGGLIEIHGEGGRQSDWTDGCVALANPDMRELFDISYKGMWITIVGTRDAED